MAFLKIISFLRLIRTFGLKVQKNGSTYFLYIDTLLFDRFIYWTPKLQELIGILISGCCGKFSIVGHKLMLSLFG